MRKIYGQLIVAALLVTVALPGMAYSRGFGAGQGPGHGSPLPWVVVRMVGRDKARSVIAADKANLQQLHSQVRAARQQLTRDLVAGKDTTNDIAALETARNNLLAERVKLAQTILSNLSTDQRAQLSQFLATWTAMQQSQRAERMKLLQGFEVTKRSSD